jgi:hypothetical protein
MNRIDINDDRIRRICAHALTRSARISERKKYVLASEYLNRRYGFALTAATLKLKGIAILKGIYQILTNSKIMMTRYLSQKQRQHHLQKKKERQICR